MRRYATVITPAVLTLSVGPNGKCLPHRNRPVGHARFVGPNGKWRGAGRSGREVSARSVRSAA